MRPYHLRARGFSLVEILSATAVLSVLLIVLVQAVGAVSRTWRLGASSADNLAQARAVMMLIERDVQAMLLRPDLAAFVDQDGKPACAFYSNVRGGDSERRLSLVGYSTAAGVGLDRSDYGLDYEERVLAFNEMKRLGDLSSAKKERFVDGAIRFECQFVTTDGRLVDAFHFDFDKPESPENTRSLVVSLLVLDDTAAKVAEETNSLPSLGMIFSDRPPAGSTYADMWKEKVLHLPATLPEPVRSGARVFERFISIPCP